MGEPLVKRCAASQNLFHFLGEALASGQGRPRTVATDASHDRRRRGPQPEYLATCTQRSGVGFAFDHAAPAIDDDAVLGAELAADLLFQIAKVAPTMGGNDVWDGH